MRRMPQRSGKIPACIEGSMGMSDQNAVVLSVYRLFDTWGGAVTRINLAFLGCCITLGCFLLHWFLHTL